MNCLIPEPGAVVDVFLQPGDYFVGDDRYVIRTLLGSCVSITLWHPAKRVGAMSHFVLPSRRNPYPTAPDARYGEEALRLMLRELVPYGIRPAECTAKIFGGANMFPGQSRAAAIQVGRKNGEAALALLQSHGIRVVSSSLYGIGHRQIRFDVRTGDVWVRQALPGDSFSQEKR